MHFFSFFLALPCIFLLRDLPISSCSRQGRTSYHLPSLLDNHLHSSQSTFTFSLPASVPFSSPRITTFHHHHLWPTSSSASPASLPLLFTFFSSSSSSLLVVSPDSVKPSPSSLPWKLGVELLLLPSPCSSPPLFLQIFFSNVILLPSVQVSRASGDCHLLHPQTAASPRSQLSPSSSPSFSLPFSVVISISNHPHHLVDQHLIFSLSPTLPCCLCLQL